jgi:Bacterial extracellular solute-binding protein
VALNVTASPDIAEAMKDTAERFNDAKPKIDNFCAEVRISSGSSADVASALVSAEGTAPKPDVWIPDSSIWVDQVRADRHRDARAGREPDQRKRRDQLGPPAP